MKISDYLKKKLVYLNAKATEKKEIIIEIGNFMKDAPEIINYNQFLSDVFEREKISSTGIGNGVAIPHARTDAVSNFVICIAKTIKELDFEAIDNKPVKLIFMLGTPKSKVNQYLQILAHLTRLLKEKTFRNALFQAKDEDTIIEIFKTAEKEN